MNGVRLPNTICGKWIWKKSLMRHPDSFAMLRREFSCQTIGEEITMWIAAVNTYQLFLNGRLIGFGPRAHQSTDAVFIDQHELGDFVENGVNVITVLVCYGLAHDNPVRTPGLWCQVSSINREILCSDERWLIRDGGEFGCNRPRFSRYGGLTSVVRADKLPLDWKLPAFNPDASWTPPDQLTPVDHFFARLELHPLPPPVISPEHPEFIPYDSGKFSSIPNFSEVFFRDVQGNGTCYAAMGHIFCERPVECEIKLFADDPFKLFCGNTLICKSDWSDASVTYDLKLRAGWNRLTLFQEPRYNAMGLTIVFKGRNTETLKVQQDMIADAPEGWTTAGPLRLSLAECTASFRFIDLPISGCDIKSGDMTDPVDIFREAQLTALPAKSKFTDPITTGTYRIFRLDKMRYGFAKLEFTADRGDIVDIITGVRHADNGFIRAATGIRGCATLHCREGVNIFYSAIPADCLYLAIIARKAKNGIHLDEVIYDELISSGHKDVEDFVCSDEQLNTFWRAGKQTLRRSSAFIPVAESGAGNDCALLDAYIDSANMAAVFGDADYIAFRLRRFVSRQYETGEIPLLTFGRRRRRQIFQMFFLPIWINYNFRFSGNRVEFERSMNCLDRTREFFESMLDNETGTLKNMEERFEVSDSLLAGIEDKDISTIFNSLFCRFLLSAAESYQLAGDETMVRHCRRIATRVANALRQYNFDPESRLFADRNITSSDAQPTVMSNFYALFAGIMPLEEFEHFFYSFFTFEPPYDRWREVSPYFQFFFLEMLFSIGQRSWAMGYFREYWSKRLCADADAWTIPGEDSPAPTQFSGGGSVSPNIFLLREILGIRIADVGHSTIFFNPAFKEVTSAKGTIPMARGRLLVQWAISEDGALDVTLNSSVPIKVVPELSAKMLAATTFRLSDQVTLLKPPDDIYEDDDN